MNSIAVITDETVPLAPGQVRFYSTAEPPLLAGGYVLQAQQTVDGLKAQPENNQFGTQNTLVISGPRFQLPAQNIQLVYPPANQSGNYEESLPHVVLRTRTLPWVRRIDGSTAGADNDGGKEPGAETEGAVSVDPDLTPPPWMALLMLYPDELAGARPQTMTVEELIRPTQNNVLPPTLVDADQMTQDELKTQLLALDLDISAFLNAAPMLSELSSLAHVREVSTDQKEIMNMVEDGWFSVIVGNRLPKTDAENSCFLVSLEGQQAHLPGAGNINPQYTKIRLVSLAAWKFTAAASRGSFLDYMQNLCRRGGVDLLQPTHFPFPDTMSMAEQQAREALEIGYLPLQNTTRSGEVTTSWYRGPLAPVPTQPDPLGPYFYSDRAIRYDQTNGLFNMAFASAWQIGQLLALSDASFATALFQWRITTYQQQQQLATSQQLAARSYGLSQPVVTHNGIAPTLLGVMHRVATSARHAINAKKPGAQAATPLAESMADDVMEHTTAHITEHTTAHSAQDPEDHRAEHTATSGLANVLPVIPVVIHHHHRDEHCLAGALAAQTLRDGIDAGQDPLHLLYQHLYPQVNS